ncbi:hypothetical protein [Chryseobacterium limigenitum]|uniref:Uncharacterized protein n=1 Tax=Chryseobacterium limigenitum TaxID=1612149 RepID=A0A1K2IZ16_9FLAO|nr:hypothetical protein [Chryseobacterium limigenitum]SFZ97027.1 hypothetical protein SAMN05216324_13416 [Chryseobacterium limigenitum]
MNKFLCFIISLFFTAFFYSQKKDSLQYVDLNQSQSQINRDLMIDYLIKRKELKEVNTNDKYEDLIITEIYGGVDIDDGICLFTTTKSHSRFYIFVELNNGIRILNLNNLGEVLQQIILYSNEKKLDNKQQLKLFNRILELFGRENRIVPNKNNDHVQGN